VQGEPREGNDNRREHRPAAYQSHGRAHTPPTRGPVLDNNRHTNTGANIDVNTDANAQPLFRRASQNLAATAMHVALDFQKKTKCISYVCQDQVYTHMIDVMS
jgi:hypothetical protein